MKLTVDLASQTITLDDEGHGKPPIMFRIIDDAGTQRLQIREDTTGVTIAEISDGMGSWEARQRNLSGDPEHYFALDDVGHPFVPE